MPLDIYHARVTRSGLEPPWITNAKQIPDALPPMEMLRAAGLDWDVFAKDVTVEHDGLQQTCKNYKALIRPLGDDAFRTLSIVSDAYRVCPNEEIAAFIKTLQEESEVPIRVHTAGEFKGGRRVFFIAQVGDPSDVVPGDTVANNLFVASGHDGRFGLSMALTTIRMVCLNMFSAVVREARGSGKWITVRHTAGMRNRLDEAHRMLSLATEGFQRQSDMMEWMSHTPVDADQVDAATQMLIPDPPDDKNPARAQAIRDRLMEIYTNSDAIQMPGVAGTAWGYLNAVTEFADHHRGNANTTQQERLYSSLFGHGATLKTKAVDALNEVLGRTVPF